MIIKFIMIDVIQDLIRLIITTILCINKKEFADAKIQTQDILELLGLSMDMIGYLIDVTEININITITLVAGFFARVSTILCKKYHTSNLHPDYITTTLPYLFVQIQKQTLYLFLCPGFEERRRQILQSPESVEIISYFALTYLLYSPSPIVVKWLNVWSSSVSLADLLSKGQVRFRVTNLDVYKVRGGGHLHKLQV